MGRRNSRSSISRPTAKKQKTSSPQSVFDENPFWKIFGPGSNHHASVSIDCNDDGHGDSCMVVDGENGGGKKHVDRALDDMLQFMELSKMRNSRHNTTSEDSDSKVGQEHIQILPIENIVQSLLTHMDDFNRTSFHISNKPTDRRKMTGITNTFVSVEDIARLLLPWSVKGILQHAYKKKSSAPSPPMSPTLELLHWKTLSECLSFFLGCTESRLDSGGALLKDRTRNNSLNILTLSTMHKLVPVALQCSLQESDDSEDDANESDLSSQRNAHICFCCLVDHLYRPPFDVVCDTLLPILRRDCARTSDSRTSSLWVSVTISTLRLMNLRLANANPKKSFQLLIRRNVFLDLAAVHLCASDSELSQGKNLTSQKELQRLQNLIDDLIRSGLFGLEHHMDGFRSLQLDVLVFDRPSYNQKGIDEKGATTKSSSARFSFRGYQEGLFLLLEKILIPHDDKNESNTFDSNDAATVSCIVPLLLRLFLEQVSKMQKQQAVSRSHKKNKATDKFGHLQFRFFACLSGYILRGLISSKDIVIRDQIHDSTLRLSLFAMLGENLDLLLKHNIYQPSLGYDKERLFLENIGKEIIQSIITQEKETKFTMTVAEWKKSLKILDVLIQLNHTILHDHLTEILGRCLAFDSNNESASDTSGTCEEASAFLVTIVATYGRLRQLDYFYLCLFDAVKQLLRQNDLQRIRQHLAFANDREISIHLGTAVEGSPIQQLQKIFSNVNESIVSGSFSERNKFGREVTHVASAVVTQFLVGLIQNVRVDSNSFSDIYPICNEIMNGSVVFLTRSGEESSGKILESKGNMKNALIICAWTVHLKNRCEFWIDEKIESSNTENFSIPPALHHILKDATTTVGVRVLKSKRSDPNVLESLKFLACQRIQQLHGECYEKQRLAYATDAKEYSTASETLEAQKLVGFILQRRDGDGRSTSKMMSQWTTLAGSITIWAPLANETNIDSFLNLLLNSVAIVDESCRRDRNLLLALFNDSSFYETPNVSQRLGMNIASFVAENMQKIMTRCNSSPNIAFSTLQEGWKTLSIESVTNFQQSGISLTCNSKNVPEIKKCMKGILRVLEVINDGGIFVWKECKDASRIFYSLMQMESFCNFLHINEDRPFLDTKVRVISALRTSASKVLTRIPLDSDGQSFETQKEDYTTLLIQILENSSKTIDHDSSSSTIHRCIDSCTTIVESLVNINLALGAKTTTSMIKVLESTFDQADVEQGGFQYLILTSYAIILLRTFGRFFGEGNDTAMIELSRVIRKRIWNTSYEYCFNTPKDARVLIQNQSIVFVAETLQLSSTCSAAKLTSLSSVENKIVSRLRSLLTQEPDELGTRSISYLVGCLAMAKPSRIVRQELTYQLLLANLKQSDMFLTPLCILAKGMETDEFDDFLSKLTSNIIDVTATTIKLRIVRMIVLSVTKESQIDVLANHSATIMNNCLQVMTQVARQIDINSDSILEVSSLIVDMASKKDMMVLRERDIALILARITSTISLCEELGETEITETQLKAYDAGFSLVSLFLQRFSKQVHNCVPSVVISLTTMLQFALSKSLPVTSMSVCGQKFSRLCELLLPHGDVYKKHIICLILRFVNSFRQDVHPTAKNSLLPGVYCLLDIIQEHETMQLNSMLDEECRALLRSIHEGYKKIHVYKGQ